MPADNATLDLFGEVHLPEGMKYQADFFHAEEERVLLYDAERLPFKEFEFRGFTGKRRTVSFGWRYDFKSGGLTKTDDMPGFLIGLRARAEAFAENPPGGFQQVLVTEYPPGAGIGWHKDRSVFEKIVGVSLGSPAILRFRQRDGSSFKRFSLPVEPRSAYLLSGKARHEWEHRIVPGEELRFSITFRTLSELGRRKAAEAQRSS